MPGFVRAAPHRQDLVAHTPDEFVSRAVQLILSRHALEDMKARVVAADLGPLYDTAPAESLSGVMAALIAGHPSLLQPKPPARGDAAAAAAGGETGAATSGEEPALATCRAAECAEAGLGEACVAGHDRLGAQVALACATGSGELRVSRRPPAARRQDAVIQVEPAVGLENAHGGPLRPGVPVLAAELVL